MIGILYELGIMFSLLSSLVISVGAAADLVGEDRREERNKYFMLFILNFTMCIISLLLMNYIWG